jgi:fatty acid desaturase
VLKYRADIRTLVFIAIYFGLVVLQWQWAPTMWWIALPLFVATCSFSFFGAVITHNTIHCPMFHSRGMNRLMQVVLTQVYGHPVSTYVPGHNMSHHRHTQTRKDVMRTQKTRHRWHLLNLFMFMPAVSGSIMRNDILFTKTMYRQRPRWFRQLVTEGIAFLGISIALVAIDLAQTGSAWRWLFYWQLPHMYAGWGIITMNLFQHDGCDGQSDWNHSRNFVGPVINWWAFNNGYHTMHHIRASLHWSLLPQAHAERVAPHIHPNLEQPSFIAYIWRTFVWPGQRTMYDGTPLVPEPAGEDISWIPAIADTPEDISFGAEVT